MKGKGRLRAPFFTGENMLSYHDLLELVGKGVIYNLESNEQVQASSIDVRLGHQILQEFDGERFLDLRERDALGTWRFDMRQGGGYYDLRPGEFVLAHTMEMFNMPDDLSATFQLKSTSARSGLGHILAVHVDPGFNNSALTLELYNITRYHTIRLHPGDFIGQMIFYRHAPVPKYASYRTKGRYNGDLTVSGVKP